MFGIQLLTSSMSHQCSRCIISSFPPGEFVYALFLKRISQNLKSDNIEHVKPWLEIEVYLGSDFKGPSIVLRSYLNLRTTVDVWKCNVCSCMLLIAADKAHPLFILRKNSILDQHNLEEVNKWSLSGEYLSSISAIQIILSWHHWQKDAWFKMRVPVFMFLSSLSVLLKRCLPWWPLVPEHNHYYLLVKSWLPWISVMAIFLYIDTKNLYDIGEWWRTA